MGTGRFLALFSEGIGSQCLGKELLKGERVRKDQTPQGPHLTPRIGPRIAASPLSVHMMQRRESSGY